jgi:arylsulfatase A-like enzyme
MLAALLGIAPQEISIFRAPHSWLGGLNPLAFRLSPTMSKNFRLVLCALLIGTAANLFAGESKPNFIVILSDDQGWGTTSVMMDPRVPESKSDFFKTPNIERMASGGMRFCQGYASHCNCSPSRAALLTGRSPAALHITDIVERLGGPNYVGNKLIPPQHDTALSSNDRTIPEILKAFDPAYRTAHFGKWHLAGGGPAKHGFDESDGPTGNGEGNRKKNLPDDPKQIFGITRRAIDFIDEEAREGHPFYLQVSHYATHAADQSRPVTFQKVASSEKGGRHRNVPYGAMLEDMDTGIGQLLDAVKAAGIADNTYIIYTADNGSVPTKDPGNINGPLHGWKASVWEGGIRVPFIVMGPGVKPGSVSRVPVVGYDILPTICELAGINKWPEAVEGGSFKAALLGDGTAAIRRPNNSLVFHWPHYQLEKHSTPDTTLISDGWKLHYWWETGDVQLFKLDADLAETEDLSKKESAKAVSMRHEMEAYLEKVKAQLPVKNPDYKEGEAPANTGAGTED